MGVDASVPVRPVCPAAPAMREKSGRIEVGVWPRRSGRAAKRLLHQGPQARKLVQMRARQRREPVLGRLREAQKHEAMIRVVRDAFDQPAFDETVGQFHGRVVADAETLREIADRDGLPAPKSLDREKRLMLARREARALRLGLAEFEEAADQIAEFREGRVIVLCQVHPDFPIRFRIRPSKARNGASVERLDAGIS